MKSIIPQIFPVTAHTIHVGKNSTFIAIDGMNENGVDYILQAIKKGASKIVIKKGIILDNFVIELLKQKLITLLEVDNTRLELAKLSSSEWGNPSKKLKIIGITGTKGKTTTVFIISNILKKAGYKVAMLTGVYNYINDHKIPSNLTTPQPDYLHTFFATCLKDGVEYVVMEVSAQALSLYRVYGIEFSGILFTNFSLEHSEFYKSQNEYFNAKYMIFSQIKKDGIVLINKDDNKGKFILKNNSKFKSYSITASSDYKTKVIESGFKNLKFMLMNKEFYNDNLFGDYNLYNLVASAAMAKEIGVAENNIVNGICSMGTVPGRLEQYILPNGAICFIDYAHNPLSFEAVLSNLRKFTDDLIVVFGAGGCRDKGKRSIMGRIAVTLCDKIFISSDNPRNEDPNKIINDIYSGIEVSFLNKVFVDEDRERAIRKAYSLSKKRSIIALLGKGNDEYQILRNETRYFSERKIIKSL